jgi:sortase (surface protein transpeptidase)
MQQLQSHYRWFRSFRRLQISAFLVIALLLFAFTNAVLFLLAQTPQNAQAQTVPNLVEKSKIPSVEVTEVTQAAAASPAPEVSNPQPAPTRTSAPKPAPASKPTPAYDRLSIASIGLSSRFITVGLTSTNAIDVHPSLVGWWNGSATPGSLGAAFLDGHNPGVFSALPSIKEGALITITKASGETFTYTVVHIETVMLAGINMRAALSTYGGAREGLNLMTCVGAYNAQTDTTDQRLVVYAVRS